MHESHTKYEHMYKKKKKKSVKKTYFFSFTFNKQECCTSGGDVHGSWLGRSRFLLTNKIDKFRKFGL
jgi:hypothetical protein